jgi:hypothetical protein
LNKQEVKQHPKVQPQAQKKSYIAKNQPKKASPAPYVEVVNLESNCPMKVVVDPLLECILKTKTDPRPLNLETPVVIPPVDGLVDEDNSSSASEFVDATQVGNDDTDDDGIDNQMVQVTDHALNERHSPSHSCDSLPTPERVARDIQFLHTSWANLADMDEQDNMVEPVLRKILRADALPVPVDNQFEALDNDVPFQEVISKKRGKKVIAANKKSYSTRAKAGSSSLFK